MTTAFAQQQSGSSSVGLEGTVTKAAPTQPAIISIPSNGQAFSATPINVSGICPSGTLVKLFRNNVFSGSANCPTGSFALSTDLFTGANELVARVYDDLDQAGPDSNLINVIFNDPGFGSSRSRVSLSSNYSKRGANPNEKLTWPITVTGGLAPYAVSLDWGDGTTKLVSRTSAGQFEIDHTYKQSGSYNLIIKATDSNGATAFLQLVAVANGLASQENTDSAGESKVVIRYVWWPLIIAAVFVLFSFWLGRKAKLRDIERSANRRTLE